MAPASNIFVDAVVDIVDVDAVANVTLAAALAAEHWWRR